MALRAWLCAFVLFQLVCVGRCLNEAYTPHEPHGGRKMELRERALLGTTVLRSALVPIDSGSTATASERFLAAVKRSQARVAQMERSVQRRAESQAQAKDVQSTVSVGSGEYVMQIAVGTPPQQFVAVADTGSDLCWVQCSPCINCFQQQDPLFNPDASSTYTAADCTNLLCEELPSFSCGARSLCSYAYFYGDTSSTRGDLAFETITLGTSSIPQVGFGCGRNNAGTFAGADGLVGLGQGPLSLPSQLTPSVEKIFSYCLVEQTSSNTGTSPIIFGASAANANVQYTPLVNNEQNPTFYYVGVTGISVGGRAVSIPQSAFRISSDGSGGVILDSGTTLTYYNTRALNPILNAFRSQISYPEVDASTYKLSLCFDVSSVPASSLSFPNMVITFANNVKYAIPAVNLFISADNSGSIFCLGITGPASLSIIGNIQQQNMLIVYDGVNQQVGFQTYQCDTL